MSDIDNVLKDFLRSSRSMESNIVSIISDSNRDIEMILKELLIYLDATSKNLEKVQEELMEFVDDYKKSSTADKIDDLKLSLTDAIKIYQEKMVGLEAANTKKILEFVKQVGITNQKTLKQIYIIVSKITNDIGHFDNGISDTNKDLQEIKTLLQVMVGDISDTKDSVNQNQNNLMTVIDNMMNANTKKSLATEEVEVQKIKSDEEKQKAKLQLVGKIVGVILGSGGVVYLIIDVIIKASGS